MTSRFVILWEFRVRSDELAAFTRAYGPGGAWAQLFGKSAGYAAPICCRTNGTSCDS